MSSLAHYLSGYPMDLNNELTTYQKKIKSSFDNECDELIRAPELECSECELSFKELDDYILHTAKCLEFNVDDIRKKATQLGLYKKRDEFKTTRQIPGDHVCKWCRTGFKSAALLKQHANRGAKTCATRVLKALINNTSIEENRELVELINNKKPDLFKKIKQN